MHLRLRGEILLFSKEKDSNLPQGKRLTSLGVYSGGSLQLWSSSVVPMSCPFERCPYPPGGMGKSWKTWQNHCSSEHGWNIASGKVSRKRAGKGEAGNETAKKVTAVQAAGTGQARSDPNARQIPRSGARTVVRGVGNEPPGSGNDVNQATDDLGYAPLRTLRKSARRLRSDASCEAFI